ncbi:MAG: type 4a pilus biogenesis protein PilO [bacterium]
MAEGKPVPKEQKIFLAVLGLVGIFMFYSKVWKPQGNKIKEFQKNIEDTRDKINKVKKDIARMKQIEAEFAKLKLKEAEVEKKLPREEELPQIIRDITATGSAHNIEIDNLRIAAVVPKEFYEERHYNFSISASYHKLAQFFTDICQKERIMTVKDLKLAPAGGAEQTPDLQTTFTLIVYTYKE